VRPKWELPASEFNVVGQIKRNVHNLESAASHHRIVVHNPRRLCPLENLL